MTPYSVTFVVLLLSLTCCPGTDAKGRRRSNSINEHKMMRYHDTCKLDIKCPSVTMTKSLRQDTGEEQLSTYSTEKGGGRLAMNLPIRGPEGRRGIQGPRGHPGKSATKWAKVAFFAGLTENLGPLNSNTEVKFDRVLTNQGGCYSTDTGYFTSKLNGTYQFSVVIAAQSRQKAGVMLLRNGEMVTAIWAESIPFWGSSSSQAVLHLSENDSVWLTLLDRASYLHGYMYSTFSGFLLFEDDA